MEAIRLEFKSEIKEKIIALLSSFSADELKIVEEDSDFDLNKKKMDASLAKIKNGTAKFYTIEEVDAILEETISKYEN
ncbi:hypothetical protein B6A10_13320 [Flavobacterium sp. L1I52]|uniref:Addiction module component n=1 Tax=Flavobacterium pokkalii TaxID=1940408 RepID=A0ABR7UWD8_9FLAO|nr:hypothetical protein [Flavobacterium pokkalii]KQB42203.1 hypothetical protein RCH33_1545 [Flavobacterium daejeonense]MBD0726154.1 hypothetical protein [Flavobacterium pokkalii]